jgi:hypothetical protein
MIVIDICLGSWYVLLSMTELQLPDGYFAERDADVLTLRRSDGSVVARFSVHGASVETIEREAQQDAQRRYRSTISTTRPSEDEPTNLVND